MSQIISNKNVQPSRLGNLFIWEEAFEKVGWFIPPFITMDFLSKIVGAIRNGGEQFDQNALEKLIAPLFSPDHLAAMVANRYPTMPYINDYKITISEAVKAHFLGLDHIAIGGLVPVIEGAGRNLAKSRNIQGSHEKPIKALFQALADDCKLQSINQGFGATEEIISMMNSFCRFSERYLFANSTIYPLPDGTNRHGITHGAYSDKDYGSPINFYKTISAIDFLTLVSAFRANMSVFAPDPTIESKKLATYYRALSLFKIPGTFANLYGLK